MHITNTIAHIAHYYCKEYCTLSMYSVGILHIVMVYLECGVSCSMR